MLTIASISNYELIIVNDGSTDATDQIIQKNLTINKRIRYFSLKKNRGVSVARNVGIDNAQGEFITFVDVDDNVSEDYLEQIQKVLAKKTKYDVICFARNNAVDGKCMEERDLVKLLSTTLGGNYIKDKDEYALTTVWSKVFRTEFIRKRKIKFKSGITFGEDILFMCEAFSDKCNTLFVHKGFYSYVQNPDSVTQSGWNEDDQYQLRKICSVFDELEAKYPVVWRNNQVQYWKACFIVYFCLLLIGRVARASSQETISSRRKLIKKQVALIDREMNFLQTERRKKQPNIDTAFRKLNFINKYPTLYLLKVTMWGKIDEIGKR